MLASLSSAFFTPFIGQTATVSDAAGAVCDLTVMAVREYPHYRLAWAEADRRTPFTVLLRGPLAPALGEGFHTVRLGDGAVVTGLGIQRILSQDGSSDGAWYQIVFN